MGAPRPKLRFGPGSGWRDRMANLDPTRKYAEYAEAGLDIAERNLLVLTEIGETLKRIEAILDQATRADNPTEPPKGSVDP